MTFLQLSELHGQAQGDGDHNLVTCQGGCQDPEASGGGLRAQCQALQDRVKAQRQQEGQRAD